MNNQTKIIIALLLIIFIGVGFLAYGYVTVKAYQQGFQDANIAINQQILNSLQSKGFVQFTFIINNQTQIINLVPYQEVEE